MDVAPRFSPSAAPLSSDGAGKIRAAAKCSDAENSGSVPGQLGYRSVSFSDHVMAGRDL